MRQQFRESIRGTDKHAPQHQRGLRGKKDRASMRQGSRQIVKTGFNLLENCSGGYAFRSGSPGFACQIEHRSHPPGYLRFNWLAFLAGVLYERTLEREFPALRSRIIVLARKTH